jgi:glutamate synthase domain-containing protein 3
VSNVLLVSFEIGWGASFQERTDYNRVHSACEEAIKRDLDAADYWAENTTLYIVRTSEASSELLNRVWQAAGMRRDKDRLVVLDVNGITGQAFGAVLDGALFSLMPQVTAPELNEAVIGSSVLESAS